MGESADQIREHIAVLSEFEAEYAEFVAALTEAHHTGNERWSREEFARRKRAILMAAPIADAAVKASGAPHLVVTEPPMLGGGVKSEDLASQVMDIGDGGFNFEDDGLAIPRQVLEMIPSQLGALKMRLREAEARGHRSGRYWPTIIFGRFRHVPPVIGFVADLGGFVTVVAFVGRMAHFW